MSSAGAAPRAAVPVPNARAEASRRNGAKSRGPKTPAGRARSAQNALKHGLRAQKYLLLPQEDAVAFHALEAALLAELAPGGRAADRARPARRGRCLAHGARRSARGRGAGGSQLRGRQLRDRPHPRRQWDPKP